MGNYETVIKKNSRPYIESLRDDITARRDKDFFWPTGTQVYVGSQGSGKTISAVKHLLDLRQRYPKAILVSNIKLSKQRAIQFETIHELKAKVKEISTTEEYIYFTNVEQLAQALTSVNNGKYGVIYVIDEIHTYFNSLDSKNIPMFVFTEISQQRKQRKLIVGTSQLFLRMAKPLREQCDSLIICNTLFGIFTKQTSYDGMSLSQDYDGSLSGHVKKVGWFFHTRQIRSSFDTFQKVTSSEQQFEFEGINRMELVGKGGKKISIK